MIAICAVLFASICVSPTYAPATKLWAMFTTQNHFVQKEADRLGAQISIDASDEFETVAPATMNRVCPAQRCIYYRRHCETAIKCSYAYSVASISVGELTLSESLEIRAKSGTAMQRAQENIWIELAEGDRGRHLPLGFLDQESVSTEPLTAPVLLGFRVARDLARSDRREPAMHELQHAQRSCVRCLSAWLTVCFRGEDSNHLNRWHAIAVRRNQYAFAGPLDILDQLVEARLQLFEADHKRRVHHWPIEYYLW